MTDIKPDYFVHDDLYKQAREAGWEGWGGHQRMANAALVDRFFGLSGIPQQGKLLELGCGEGHHCRLFAQHGYEVSGVDISPTAIAWANEKAAETGCHGQFLVADLTNPCLKLPERYNIVIDGNCLHCIIGADRAVFLMQVFHALETRGIFFVSSLCSKDNNNYQTDRDGLPYRHVASAENLQAELKQAGFRVIKTRLYEREKFNHITVHAVKPG
ncbi:bifunctional 3-demethylubiquinone-9 3-methyltransferase/ 2-octaprenyl-6-hydroxy phenol methylase [Vibrio aerogenes CECT 7868]|uniref:Bifunctional 3-demethylubiquinone-9 3-methyltransferase/ 2-octaprenyl-6-hydroxy phenol methylase n=1 Tax=Vibrio aerogenes CECT 7868 TaxID=1216006 RepID=A0A1M5VGW4_9VIBR|nr:class I SAM-dependent methyltransferase [Vibrio aerogenes]SHH74163.1 bifunctional 3-demethylubiquinone-9 3-methyltransferase/ 2-octaprenyl-6-hydroxy phenol methylase [Vibrio aerogenes CECT 7868]